LHKTQAAAELRQCSPSSQFGWQTEAAQKGFRERAVTRKARGSVFGLSGQRPDRVLKLLLEVPFFAAE
jgi:hypothetical protein